MDFVERWFGVSPDGGSGTFEVALIFAAAVVVIGLVCISKLFGTFSRPGAGAARTRS